MFLVSANAEMKSSLVHLFVFNILVINVLHYIHMVNFHFLGYKSSPSVNRNSEILNSYFIDTQKVTSF